MKSKGLIVAIFSLLWLLTACSSGSSSSGGGGASGGSIPTTVTYSLSDLEGTWDFTAVQITSDEKITGSMTFNSTGLLTDFKSSKCPGQTFSYSEFWYLGDGWIKGRVYGFCNDPDIYDKFGMQFSDKYTMAGDMDVHYAFPGKDETYQRYTIKFKKPAPPSPPPIIPDYSSPMAVSNSLSKRRR
jgi:hypothetical protein